MKIILFIMQLKLHEHYPNTTGMRYPSRANCEFVPEYFSSVLTDNFAMVTEKQL